MILLPILLILTFLVISGIHFNWALGGKWGFDGALPTNEAGERLFTPGKLACAVVGLGLLSFAFFYFLKISDLDLPIPEWVMYYIGWIIPSIFLVRAIGDFKYSGFFKKVRDTEFGELDSRIYSPLCLAIGVVGILVQML